jgi:hypothetical protein
VAHEGVHVEDADTFAATITSSDHWDLSKNLTKYQTEMNAYRITNLVLGDEGTQLGFGKHGGCPCALGGERGPMPNPDPNIKMLLADPKNGYGVTEQNQGARQNSYFQPPPTK